MSSLQKDSVRREDFRDSYGRIGYGVAVFSVFATSMHSGVLGALLTFAGRVWYPIYAERTSVWGMSPLEGPGRRRRPCLNAREF